MNGESGRIHKIELAPGLVLNVRLGPALNGPVVPPPRPKRPQLTLFCSSKDGEYLVDLWSESETRD